VDPTLEPPPHDPDKDFAVGGFRVGQRNVAFSAHRDGPKAEDAWGHMSFTRVDDEDVKGRWRVVCLVVSGSKASMGLEPQDSAANDFTSRIHIVRDSTLPGGTGDTVDFFPPTSQ
jgi:hypothetical protein